MDAESQSNVTEVVPAADSGRAAPTKSGCLTKRLGCSFAGGIVAGGMADAELLGLAIVVIIQFYGCLLLIQWFRLDAATVDYPTWSGFGIKLLVFSPVTVPYYFVASRGFVRGLGGIVLALVFFAIDLATSYAGIALTGQV
ncbi:MAG: hypothetical protein ACYTGL_15750 [Planctomycetota bacterium]|jgi:hypothetical protein